MWILRRKIVAAFLTWLMLRIYEFGFVMIISPLLQLTLSGPFYKPLFEEIIALSKGNFHTWAFFLVIPFYWLTSLIGAVIAAYTKRNLNIINCVVYFVHSTGVLILFKFFIFSSWEVFMFVLNIILTWLSIGVFNYFSPRFLPQSLKQAFRS